MTSTSQVGGILAMLIEECERECANLDEPQFDENGCEIEPDDYPRDPHEIIEEFDDEIVDILENNEFDGNINRPILDGHPLLYHAIVTLDLCRVREYLLSQYGNELDLNLSTNAKIPIHHFLDDEEEMIRYVHDPRYDINSQFNRKWIQKHAKSKVFKPNVRAQLMHPQFDASVFDGLTIESGEIKRFLDNPARYRTIKRKQYGLHVNDATRVYCLTKLVEWNMFQIK